MLSKSNASYGSADGDESNSQKIYSSFEVEKGIRLD
jgi:hypothetical protein